MDYNKLRELLNKAVDEWVATQPTFTVSSTAEPVQVNVPVPTEEVEVERVFPEGKRVVRTKTSGDRVYELDEVAKTRRWVTNGDILTAFGWQQADVVAIDDSEILKYTMGPAIYKVD